MNALKFIAALGSVLAASFPAHALQISSETHPYAVFYPFSSPEVPFKAYELPDPTRPGVHGLPSGARFEVKEGALLLTNAHSGSFGVQTAIPAFDAEKFGHLFFDYRLSPEVKVNLFFKVQGKYHGVVFSGPRRVRPGGVLLGAVSNVRDDGEWHRAYIPLRAWLRRLYPLADALKVDEIIIGNWDNEGFLMAGVGGNGPEAQWSLDNFAITAAGPSEAKLEIKANDGQTLANPQEYSWSLDNKPRKPLESGTLSVAAPEGFHLVRLRDKAGRAAGEYPLFSTAAPPQVGKPSLEGNVLVVPIRSAAGLQIKGVSLAVGERNFDLSSPHLVWDGNALRLDAAAAGLHWKNNERIPLVLKGLGDVLGRKLAEATEAGVAQTLVIDYASHKAAPALPLVRFGPETEPFQPVSFEESTEGWETRGERGAIVERDATTSVTGKYSLRLTCPSHAAPFAAWVRREGFDALKYPIISFYYRVPPALRADFQIAFEGQTYSIGFTDTDAPTKDKATPPPRLGAISGIEADNRWHYAEFNLLQMLRQRKPGAGNYRVEWLAVGDAGWLGNHRGLQYWIDDFQLVPAITGETLNAPVQVRDVTGLKGVSWVLDDKPTTEPSKQVKNAERIEDKGKGRRWLHVRAQNGAGIWGPAAHYPVVLGE